MEVKLIILFLYFLILFFILLVSLTRVFQLPSALVQYVQPLFSQPPFFLILISVFQFLLHVSFILLPL